MIFEWKKVQLLMTLIVTSGKLCILNCQILHLYKKCSCLYNDFWFAVLAATDMIASIDQFIAKVMSGIELTTIYTISFGKNYPPIDEDVTFWCVMP